MADLQRNHTSFIDQLQYETRKIDEDTFQIILPINSFIMNALNIVHGGITATLADSTMGSFINSKLPKGVNAVTTEMKVNYVSPGKGKKLISTAKIVNMGRQLVVAECRISNEKDKLIAIATATFFIVKEEDL